MRQLLSTIIVLSFAAALVSPAAAGDRHYRSRDNGDAGAALMFGIIAGAVIGGALANGDRRYYAAPRYVAPRDRYYGGYYLPWSGYDFQRTQRCGRGAVGHNSHYQGRLVYRNGCYYPG